VWSTYLIPHVRNGFCEEEAGVSGWYLSVSLRGGD